MTTEAVVGRVVRALPYLWIEWLCVDPCGAPVALTRLDIAQQKVETKSYQFMPVRVPEADRDGRPYFGPGRRDLKGKSSRRHPAKLAAAAWDRQRLRKGHRAAEAWADPETARKLIDDPDYVIEPEFADYAPIEAEDFDTICMKSAERLRIRIANALADAVSS